MRPPNGCVCANLDICDRYNTYCTNTISRLHTNDELIDRPFSTHLASQFSTRPGARYSVALAHWQTERVVISTLSASLNVTSPLAGYCYRTFSFRHQISASGDNQCISVYSRGRSSQLSSAQGE